MKRIPIAVVAALVLGAPLAFAADNNLPSPAAMNTIHCTNLETPSASYGGATGYSSDKRQAAMEEAMSLCRWDFHKNGGVHQLTQPTTPRRHGSPLFFMVRH